MASVHLVSEDLETVSCDSSWKEERECHQVGSQTSPTAYGESENQTSTVTNVAIQTHDLPLSSSNVDFDKLAAWLTHITPQVLKELDNVDKSRAFYGYKLQENRHDSDSKLLYVLDQTCQKSQVFVSSIAWSSSGGVIAVAFCFPKHQSWCDHSGLIALYHVNRQDFKPSVPNRRLELSSCVTIISCHPTEPYIIACGTFSGEVFVWNLQREEPTSMGNSSQSESITHAEWVRSDTSQKPLLVTSSQDGSVCIWKVKIGSSSLKPIKLFLLQSEKMDIDLGITCAAFNPKSTHQFLAGVDGGSILLCSSESRRPLSHRKEKQGFEGLDFYDPIMATFDGHKGAVTGVLWTVFDSDKFMTCGLDSELHIYSSSQLTLLRVFHFAEPCLGMTICLPRPHLVALWGSSHQIVFFNTHLQKEVKTLKLDASGSPAPLTTVCFQNEGSFTVAAGDMNGQVQVLHASIDMVLEEVL